MVTEFNKNLISSWNSCTIFNKFFFSQYQSWIPLGCRVWIVYRWWPAVALSEPTKTYNQKCKIKKKKKKRIHAWYHNIEEKNTIIHKHVFTFSFNWPFCFSKFLIWSWSSSIFSSISISLPFLVAIQKKKDIIWSVYSWFFF